MSSGEDDVVEEDEDFNSTEIACGHKGGNWSNGKCSCKNAKGKSITTSNPVKDCVEQSAAKSNEEKVKEKSGGDEKENKKKVLSDSQKSACTARDGTVSADATMCSCKDRNGRDIDTDNPINKCVKPRKSASENTDGDSTDAGDGGSRDKCVSEVKFKYNMMTIPKEARYKEILASLKTKEKQEYNKCLDAPLKDTGEHKCTVNGQTFKYTVVAGDTVRGRVPEPCWMVLCPTQLDMFLENQAQEQFLDEKIEQECR